MRHVEHLNESYHTSEWVMSHMIESCHIWSSDITHPNASCHKFKRVTITQRQRWRASPSYSIHIWSHSYLNFKSFIFEFQVIHIWISSHSYFWRASPSNIWMSRVTHTNKLYHTATGSSCRATPSYMNGSCHICGCVVSHTTYVQGGKVPWDALSLLVIFCKRAL